MTRYLLSIELPEGAALELSTSYPQGAEMVDNSRKLSTGHRKDRQRATQIDNADSTRVRRLGASAPPAAQGELRDLPTLSEDDLIRAHGLVLVGDTDWSDALTRDD